MVFGSYFAREIMSISSAAGEFPSCAVGFSAFFHKKIWSFRILFVTLHPQMLQRCTRNRVEKSTIRKKRGVNSQLYVKNCDHVLHMCGILSTFAPRYDIAQDVTNETNKHMIMKKQPFLTVMAAVVLALLWLTPQPVQARSQVWTISICLWFAPPRR